MYDLCRGGCRLEMAHRRTAEIERKKTRMRTYRRILLARQKADETCYLCSVPVEVLHHKDEDQSNNRHDNLLSCCKEHHLAIEHTSDSESYRFEEEAVMPRSSMTWSSSKEKRSLRKPLSLASEQAVARSTPPYLPWTTHQGGRVSFFRETRWINHITGLRVTASGTPRLMRLLESIGLKEVPRVSQWGFALPW